MSIHLRELTEKKNMSMIRPAQGSVRPVCKVAPHLNSAHGSIRVDPRRKWIERFPLQGRTGDPKVEPAAALPPGPSSSRPPPQTLLPAGRRTSGGSAPSSSRALLSAWPPRSSPRRPPSEATSGLLRLLLRWPEPPRRWLLQLRLHHQAATMSTIKA
jgi:hypothetical protein